MHSIKPNSISRHVFSSSGKLLLLFSSLNLPCRYLFTSPEDPVSIGGHIFKALLYDKGPGSSGGYKVLAMGESSSVGGAGHQLKLITAGSVTVATASSSTPNIGGIGSSSAATYNDPAALYPTRE
ncbi:hypothetical protein F2Q68_00024550 [Brassica cretica]|uniref:Uncharacterized protein n=1 Tax=Brassica cretica TaxID=69181 RepID=A0A8S9I6F6_BRACR|nr:hypothetical protein F2Q68_00024550 [Brassica cretica]